MYGLKYDLMYIRDVCMYVCMYMVYALGMHLVCTWYALGMHLVYVYGVCMVHAAWYLKINHSHLI